MYYYYYYYYYYFIFFILLLHNVLLLLFYLFFFAKATHDSSNEYSICLMENERQNILNYDFCILSEDMM